MKKIIGIILAFSFINSFICIIVFLKLQKEPVKPNTMFTFFKFNTIPPFIINTPNILWFYVSSSDMKLYIII